ncbi:hypothetical protein EVAR_96083_1 [Eumeta japonica]|uniref:Uncharacterized protein n=1 Tax=Eumeta variegata TaxID=151549 RepID=A0A4C1VF08_EUMVA|nr:hypothetical protein EVAR_96083_1 [Eumeta japonica]
MWPNRKHLAACERPSALYHKLRYLGNLSRYNEPPCADLEPAAKWPRIMRGRVVCVGSPRALREHSRKKCAYMPNHSWGNYTERSYFLIEDHVSVSIYYGIYS